MLNKLLCTKNTTCIYIVGSLYFIFRSSEFKIVRYLRFIIYILTVGIIRIHSQHVILSTCMIWRH